MAPLRMKTRSELGVKESLAFKAKHPPVPVTKRKADGSPLKSATTTQVKRHLIDNAAKENVLIKNKSQLINLTTTKKPLGLRNLNTNSVGLARAKVGKTVTTDGSMPKKDVMTCKVDSKENSIVTRMSLAKISDVKVIGSKVTTVSLKTKETKTVLDEKNKETKTTVTRPLGLRDVNKDLVRPVETKSKVKTELKITSETKNIVHNQKSVHENRRTSLIPINVNKLTLKKTEVSVRTTGPVTRQSLGRKSSDNESTLYESALEDVLNDTNFVKTVPLRQIKLRKKRPIGVEDFDSANQDLFSVGKYAFEIFEYLKGREKMFRITNYMPKQKGLSKNMRALLVDWLAEIQENFELNHETLYLAVKIIDLYLSKVIISKDQLQLLGATAMLISCKYDERISPLLDDFIDVSDNHFSAKDVMAMECKVLKAIKFELGCPLSYRFLRRYARCAKFGMATLTLARYILELSLMEFSMALESESKLAAAALYLALRMKKESVWTPTLEYYSGYKLEDFKELVLSLNAMLHQKPKEKLCTIRKKYSHEIFHRVTEIPLLDNVDFSSAHS